MKVEHAIKERRLVAKLLCKQPSDLTHQTNLEYRIQTINTLIALCRVREAPRQQKRVHDRSWGILKDDEPKFDPPPITITSKQCLFCFSDTQLSYESRTFSFSRPRKAREHVERQHLRFYKANDPIPCPHPACTEDGVVLGGHMHFKNHAAGVHKSFLFPMC